MNKMLSASLSTGSLGLGSWVRVIRFRFIGVRVTGSESLGQSHWVSVTEVMALRSWSLG